MHWYPEEDNNNNNNNNRETERMEELLSNVRHESLPESYILPMDKRPGLIINKSIPVIDLAAHDHEQIAMEILQAGKEFGFFQVLSKSITCYL